MGPNPRHRPAALSHVHCCTWPSNSLANLGHSTGLRRTKSLHFSVEPSSVSEEHEIAPAAGGGATAPAGGGGGGDVTAIGGGGGGGDATARAGGGGDACRGTAVSTMQN